MTKDEQEIYDAMIAADKEIYENRIDKGPQKWFALRDRIFHLDEKSGLYFAEPSKEEVPYTDEEISFLDRFAKIFQDSTLYKTITIGADGVTLK